MSLRKILRFRVRLQLSQSRCLSLLLLTMSGRVLLFFFPPRGHEPPPTLLTASTQTSAFRAIVFQSPDMPNARMSLCTQSVHSVFLLPTPSSSPHCVLKVSEHDSLWQPPAAHSEEERPRPQKKSSRAQRCLNQCSRTGLFQGHGTESGSYPTIMVQ